MSENKKIILYCLITLLLISGVGVRAYKIDFHSLDNDEGMVLPFIKSNNLCNLFQKLQHEPHPPLYYILIYYWSKFLGNTIISWRLLSVITGSFFLLMIILITYESFEKKFIIPILLFNSFSPSLIWISQRLRMYSLLLLLLYLTLYIFIKKLNSKKTIWNIFFIISATLTIYTHYYGHFFILALLITEFIESRKPIQKKYIIKILIPYLIIFLLFLPFLFILANQLINFGKQMTDFTWRKNNIIIESLKSGVYFSAGRSAIRAFSFNYDAARIYFIFLIFPPLLIIYFILNGLLKQKNRKIFFIIFLITLLITIIINIKIPLFKATYLVVFAPLLYFYAGRMIITKKNIFLLFFYFILIFYSLFQYYTKPNPWQTDWKQLIKDLKNHDSKYKYILFYSGPPEVYNHYFSLENPDIKNINFQIKKNWFTKFSKNELEIKIQPIIKNIENFYYLNYCDVLNNKEITEIFRESGFNIAMLKSYEGCDLSLWKKK